MNNNQNNKNEYARHISLFLAELLRSRKIGLVRASEIARKVVQNINLIDTESDFLKLVKELTRDFDELFILEEKVHMHVHVSERKDLERKVRLFVVSIMPTDMNQALSILSEAVKDDTSINDLFSKFPEFKKFTETNLNLWTKIH